MSRRLERITDWPERATRANWCVQTLAEHCGVSLSTLERHIKRQFGACAHDWMEQMRMQRAVKLLLDDFSVKHTALELGYKYAQHFSRDFRNHTGHPPSQQVAKKHKAQALRA